MRIIAILLLSAFLLAINPILILKYDVDYEGNIVASAELKYVFINNSSKPLDVRDFNITVPPYGVRTVVYKTSSIYPQPCRIEFSINYVNASLTDGVLTTKGDAHVIVSIKARNFMPFAIPIVITISARDGVGVAYDVEPTSVQQIGAYTAYHWAIYLENSTQFRIMLTPEKFGSFGTVRLPQIVVTSTIDLDLIARQEEEKMSKLTELKKPLLNFTNNIKNFTKFIENEINNLNNLINIFNLSSYIFKEASRAVNASTYGVLALNSQLSAISNSIYGIAQIVNNSRLLVEYQYVQLITLANALETQASAISAYENSTKEAVATLSKTAAEFEKIRRNIYSIKIQLKNSIIFLETQKNNLNKLSKNIKNETLKNIIYRSIEILNDVINTLENIENSLNLLIDSIHRTIKIINYIIEFLESTSSNLKEVRIALETAARDARFNATYVITEMPDLLLNISRDLVETSRNLNNVIEEVEEFLTPLRNASAVLLNVSRALSSSAERLREYVIDLKGNMPMVGAFEGYLNDYLYRIDQEINLSKQKLKIIKTYKKIYNTNKIITIYTLSLPIVMKELGNFSIVQGGETEGEYQIPLNLMILIIIASSSLYILKRVIK